MPNVWITAETLQWVKCVYPIYPYVCMVLDCVRFVHMMALGCTYHVLLKPRFLAKKALGIDHIVFWAQLHNRDIKQTIHTKKKLQFMSVFSPTNSLYFDLFSFYTRVRPPCIWIACMEWKKNTHGQICIYVSWDWTWVNGRHWKKKCGEEVEHRHPRRLQQHQSIATKYKTKNKNSPPPSQLKWNFIITHRKM